MCLSSCMYRKIIIVDEFSCGELESECGRKDGEVNDLRNQFNHTDNRLRELEEQVSTVLYVYKYCNFSLLLVLTYCK